MFGGLAGHETITTDAFALVACHELGHHIGGAQRKQAGGAELTGHRTKDSLTTGAR